MNKEKSNVFEVLGRLKNKQFLNEFLHQIFMVGMGLAVLGFVGVIIMLLLEVVLKHIFIAGPILLAIAIIAFAADQSYKKTFKSKKSEATPQQKDSKSNKV